MQPDAERKQVLLQQLGVAFTSIPFNHMLGLRLVHIDDKQVTMQFSMKAELVGNFVFGILHGGVISSVLDMAGGMVVMSAGLHENLAQSETEIAAIISKTSTINLNINYINPGRGESFIAKAQLIKRGKKISFTRMELLNQDEILIATGNATYIS